MTIIGGADGPTQVYVASQFGWLNVFGLIIVVLMLIPNIIYAIRHKGAVNKCENRAANLLEQAGRYGCMLLMVFNIGIAQRGFASVELFIAYLAGNAVLLLAYFVFWIIYSRRQSFFTSLMLAILPTALFLVSGFTMQHWLLVGFAILFGVFHIYVTAVNARSSI